MELKQVPVIIHKLQEVGELVKKRISDLDIENMVATEDSFKSLKELRAELNKEYKHYESQLKLIVDQASKPIIDVKDSFKLNIKSNYDEAVSLLKEKIDKVDLALKTAKKNNLVEYFNETVDSYDIDFLKFEHTKLEVNLSTTENKYKEQIKEFVQQVTDDIDLIKKNQYSDEILIEYKKTLNCSKAITDVQTRKEELKRIEDQRKQKELDDRKKELTGLGLFFDKDTLSYVYDDSCYIQLSEVEKIDMKQFSKRLHEITSYIENANKAQNTDDNKQDNTNTEQEIESVNKEPLRAPEQVKENNVCSIYYVEAPFPVIKQLAAFMDANLIKRTNVNEENYKNFLNV